MVEPNPESVRSYPNPEEKAWSIASNWDEYVVGGKSDFYANLVRGYNYHEDVDKHFLARLGVELDHIVAFEVPTPIMVKDGVTLFRWSEFADSKPIDTWYEACREGEQLTFWRPADSI
jgi:hypothetical protein